MTLGELSEWWKLRSKAQWGTSDELPALPALAETREELRNRAGYCIWISRIHHGASPLTSLFFRPLDCRGIDPSRRTDWIFRSHEETNAKRDYHVALQSDTTTNGDGYRSDLQ